jgi:hypothetical protein
MTRAYRADDVDRNPGTAKIRVDHEVGVAINTVGDARHTDRRISLV